jgi:hypothetical protein
MDLGGFGYNFTLKEIPPKICARIAAYDESGEGIIGKGIYTMQATYEDGSTANSAHTNVHGGVGTAHSPSDAGTFCQGIVDLVIFYKIYD